MFEFIPMNISHQDMVLKWRSDSDVTKYMFTDISGKLEDQIRWFQAIEKIDTEKYWIIHYKSVPIGVISLNGIDARNKKSSAGFYIGEEQYRRFGFMVLPYLYNYVFNEMKFNKLVAEIMDGNINVIKMHEMLGFNKVGIFHDHIFKNENYYDVHIFELSNEDWQKKGQRYHGWTAIFD